VIRDDPAIGLLVLSQNLLAVSQMQRYDGGEKFDSHIRSLLLHLMDSALKRISPGHSLCSQKAAMKSQNAGHQIRLKASRSRRARKKTPFIFPLYLQGVCGKFRQSVF
jgi:hypothetical protein